MCLGDISVWQRHIGLHRKHLRGDERLGRIHFVVLSEEFCVRHPALQQQSSPVSLTDIFSDWSVSVCVWVLGFVSFW